MSNFQKANNQLSETTQLPFEELKARVLQWLHHEAGFAQVYSINKAGYPVGRTMAAPVDDDFTVSLVQRKVHKRMQHWQRNPRSEVLWLGTPAPGSRNDTPHVYDCNLLVPRAVFVRGDVEFVDDATLLEMFQRQTAKNLARGWIKAPVRTPDNVLVELIGVRIRALQVRVEGFGEGAASYQWQPNRTLAAANP